MKPFSHSSACPFGHAVLGEQFSMAISYPPTYFGPQYLVFWGSHAEVGESVESVGETVGAREMVGGVVGGAVVGGVVGALVGGDAVAVAVGFEFEIAAAVVESLFEQIIPSKQN